MIYIDSILEIIFTFNNIYDHANLSSVCKLWKDISYSDLIWKDFYIKYLDMHLLYNFSDDISNNNYIWRTLFYKRYFIRNWIDDIIKELEDIPIIQNKNFQNNYCVACYYEKYRLYDNMIYNIYNNQTMCILCHKHIFDNTQLNQNQMIFKKGINLNNTYYIMYSFYNYIDHYISLIFHNINNKNILYYKQYTLS
jgi:hypothetical protein